MPHGAVQTAKRWGAWEQVRAKERRAAQLEALQRRSQEKCGHLLADIQTIKQQKARGNAPSKSCKAADMVGAGSCGGYSVSMQMPSCPVVKLPAGCTVGISTAQSLHYKAPRVCTHDAKRSSMHVLARSPPLSSR